MASAPVILILGSGPRIGQSVAKSFAAKGYKVASTSRKANEADNTANHFNITGDLADPASIPAIFSKVKEKFGIPSVVVYNAAAAAFNDATDPLSVDTDVWIRNLNINLTSVYVAAKEAAKGFAQLPASAAKTFIYTGNCLNEKWVLARLVDCGVGKSGAAHLMHASAKAYADKGFKFYYADERKPDGEPAFMDVDGEAAGKYYLQLAEGASQGSWQQTFVKDVGYKEFPSK